MMQEELLTFQVKAIAFRTSEGTQAVDVQVSLSKDNELLAQSKPVELQEGWTVDMVVPVRWDDEDGPQSWPIWEGTE